MPRLAPVTSATLPLRSKEIVMGHDDHDRSRPASVPVHLRSNAPPKVRRRPCVRPDLAPPRIASRSTRARNEMSVGPVRLIVAEFEADERRRRRHHIRCSRRRNAPSQDPRHPRNVGYQPRYTRLPFSPGSGSVSPPRRIRALCTCGHRPRCPWPAEVTHGKLDRRTLRRKDSP